MTRSVSVSPNRRDEDRHGGLRSTHRRLLRLLNGRRGLIDDVQEQAEQKLARVTSNPFVREIREQAPPAKFATPSFELYEGKSDPVSHVSMYANKMALWESNDALMCKLFPSCLGKVAIRWFHSLHSDSVRSWSQLARKFVSHFIANSRESATIDSLYAIRMRKDESLRQFAARFMERYSDINECDAKSAIGAFKLALPQGCRLRENLVLERPTGVAELQERIRQYVNLEDDFRAGRDRRSRTPPCKNGGGESGHHRQGSRSHSGRGFHPAQTQQAVHAVFKLPMYEILNRIKDKSFFRWPAPLRSNPSRGDQSKYCFYHKERGHTTMDCKALRHFLDQMVEKGHLKEFLAEKTDVVREQRVLKELALDVAVSDPKKHVIHVIESNDRQSNSS